MHRVLSIQSRCFLGAVLLLTYFQEVSEAKVGLANATACWGFV